MHGKRILLGITGGIAAYKIAFLIRILKNKGAEVKCIMTPASSDFISPLVVSTLSGNPVSIEFWNKSTGEWNNHVAYAEWADVFVVAPLTANTLAKMATGSCDNLLLATYLSMKGKTIAAPAMDLDMYAHGTTRRNLLALQADGVQIIPAESGFLASGLEGEGRMAEPETIVSYIEDHFASEHSDLPLLGKKVLITAGPTHEAIDPVRFIGNNSSGKMGYMLAENCLKKGASVVLISGPTSLELSHPNLQLARVTSAEEMFEEVQANWKDMNIGIFAAAVADYRPKHKADQKIKKEQGELQIDLVKNPDLLAWAGKEKKDDQLLIGFALETINARAFAEKKLIEKKLNFIVVNSLEDEGAGFAVDTNKISLLDDRNNFTSFELKSKALVADDIINYLLAYLK